MKGPNLRYELRAYTTADACRTAWILRELVGQTGSQEINRSSIVQRWAERYPRHTSMTGRRTIRARITKSLSELKAAGIARSQGSIVVVMAPDRLDIAANNLSIVEENGEALRPARWRTYPEVPDHLVAIRDLLDASRSPQN